MKTLSVILLLIAMCGCVTPPGRPETKEIGSPTDRGAKPDEAAIVKMYIDVNFKDPDSVKELSVLPATEGEYEDFANATRTYGYIVTFFCNAKNSFGGYTGYHSTILWVRDGNVVGHL
jgi:hypothetical protein